MGRITVTVKLRREDYCAFSQWLDERDPWAWVRYFSEPKHHPGTLQDYIDGLWDYRVMDMLLEPELAMLMKLTWGEVRVGGFIDQTSDFVDMAKLRG